MLYLFVIPLGLLFGPWLLIRYVFRTPQTAALPYATLAPYLAAAAGDLIHAAKYPYQFRDGYV